MKIDETGHMTRRPTGKADLTSVVTGDFTNDESGNLKSETRDLRKLRSGNLTVLENGAWTLYVNVDNRISETGELMRLQT